jgi:hypothetical protein
VKFGAHFFGGGPTSRNWLYVASEAAVVGMDSAVDGRPTRVTAAAAQPVAASNRRTMFISPIFGSVSELAPKDNKVADIFYLKLRSL